MSYREDEHYALTTYREVPGRNDAVDLDRGHVFATDRTVAPPNSRTLVYSTKAIIFTDDALNGFTDLACDNGWVELMINMALPQGRRTEVQPAAGGQPEAAGAEPPRTEVEEWAASVHHLIDRCVDRIGTSVNAVRDGRFDLDLLDEILTAGDDVTATVTKGARAFREIVGRLADPGGRR